ncbi:hypothetical protein BOG92_007535 [Streptomyces sp. WAC00263]|nr:hypothetical protein BOG92_007535 [Streptomyces sp. WAC00263]
MTPPTSSRASFSRSTRDIGRRSAGVIHAGGTLVSIAGPPEARPADGLAIDFVVVPDPPPSPRGSGAGRPPAGPAALPPHPQSIERGPAFRG